MKRGTDLKLKFKELKARLSLDLWQTKGLLQALWDFTAENAIHGDIGKFTDEQIAVGIEWPLKNAGELVEALVASRWVDEHEEHRLVVHDWSEHAEDWIQARIARAREWFSDGSAPRLSKLERDARVEAEAFYMKDDLLSDTIAESRDGTPKRDIGGHPAGTRQVPTGAPAGTQRGPGGPPVGRIPGPEPSQASSLKSGEEDLDGARGPPDPEAAWKLMSKAASFVDRRAQWQEFSDVRRRLLIDAMKAYPHHGNDVGAHAVIGFSERAKSWTPEALKNGFMPESILKPENLAPNLDAYARDVKLREARAARDARGSR